MRNAARLKMGYYPLPESEGAKLRSLLSYTQPASVIDPCVGQGAALHSITSDAVVRRYGVELDAERARIASSKSIETIQGNTFDAIAKPESFSLLYLNPPYDSEIGSIANRRMEAVFLEHAYRWLVMQGVLVMVIPFERLHDCAGVLSSHFAALNVFRMTDPDSVQYRQIAVLGVRRDVRGVAVENNKRQLQGVGLYGSFQKLPELQPDACAPYSVPASGEVEMSYRGLPYDLLEDLLPLSGAWRQAAPLLLPHDDVATGRPITPLHGGHVGRIRPVDGTRCKPQIIMDISMRIRVIFVRDSRCNTDFHSSLASFRLFFFLALLSQVRRMSPCSRNASRARFASPGAAVEAGETVVAMLKLLSTPMHGHPYQVVRDDGLPDVMLSLFAHDLLQSLSPASVPLYMRELIALCNWMATDSAVQQHGWNLFGPAMEVRNVVRQYLIFAAKCKLTFRADQNGVKATYVSVTGESRINVRILLAALRRLFEFLITSEHYAFPNPMLLAEVGRVTQELRQQYRRAIKEIEGRDPMPPVSGIDPPSGIRLSANFFRCVEQEWVPKTIDDPDFPLLVYQAGKNWGWNMRETCIARTVFECGGRISEVLDLTALDWSVSQFLNQFLARNKGSHSMRTKRFIVSMPTAKLIRKYFDDEQNGRRKYDPERLTLSQLGEMSRAELARVSIFLTNRGGPLTAKSYRSDHWNPALRAAGLSAQPHLARHWFVTNALRRIEKEAKDEKEVTRRKAELIQYMAWSSGERMLRVYEHIVRSSRFVETTVASIHKAMRKRELEIKRDPTLLSRFVTLKPSEVTAEFDEDLAILTGALE